MTKKEKYIGTSIVSATLTFIKCVMLIGFGYAEPFTFIRKFGYVFFEFLIIEAFFLVILWGYSHKDTKPTK